MSKKKAESLYLLIQGMTKNEKRHFKLYARSHSPNSGSINYLELFDHIASQKEYNEEALVSLNLVKPQHFRMLKNYLYNLILESLRVLRGNRKEIDIEIRNLIENARIMREKGIEREEKRLWMEARDKAISHERWGQAFEALYMLSEKLTRDIDVSGLEQAEKDMILVTEKMKNLVEYKESRRKALQLLRTLDTQKAVRNKKVVESLLNSPLLRNEKDAGSAAANKERYFTRLVLKGSIGDFESTLKELDEAHEFIRNNYDKLDFPEYHHASVLSNMSARQMETGRFKEAFPTIQQHRSLKTRSITAHDYIFIFSHINLTNYYLATGEYEKGIGIVKDMDDEMKSFRSLIHYPSIYVIYFNTGSIFLGAGRYDEALKWIRRIINAPAGACGEDIRAWAFLLTLIIHFEKNTADILDHLTSAARHFLNRRARLFRVEESLLKFMNKLNKTGRDDRSRPAEFQKFKDELTEITKDPKEAHSLMYFDLFSWVESKIRNKPVSFIVKEKI